MLPVLVLLLFALPLAPQRAQAAGAPLDTLTARWAALRDQPGHFSGGAWNDDVDRWDGSKHQVMRALAQALVHQAVPAPELQRRLGEPDLRLAGGSAEQGRARAALSQFCAAGRRPAAHDELLAYAWRGRHDMLLLWVHQGRLAGCGWLHQWE